MSIYWVDIIKAIVDDVRADAGLSNDAPYYMFGHPLEIINTLSMKDKSDNFKYKKYPLIALFQDFTESYGDNAFIKSEVSLNIAIITNSSQNYIASERYDNNFRVTLQPLYELLIEKLVSSKQFLEIDIGLVPHDKTDRLFWGAQGLYGNEGNIFNDYIDAIEIDNLELKLGTLKKC
ncbi:hypothetical protein KA005_52970 [bacterium]|nr:hypothetical protein [bacterium]